MKILSLLSAVLLVASGNAIAQTVPSGTVIIVRLIDRIDSTKTGAGERFRASIDDPVILGDRVVIPRNADATVQVVKAEKSNELSIKLYDVTVNGKIIDTVSNYAQVTAPGKGSKYAKRSVGLGALGAAVGGIAGGGKGAAIGAVSGAGLGAATVAARAAPRFNCRRKHASAFSCGHLYRLN